MAGRHILYLSTQQLAAYRCQAGTVHANGSFEHTPAGLDAFANYLQANSHSQFTLLVNLAEEALHAETIPCLRAGDRRAVIVRKLSQQFGATPYTAALSLGHEKHRRRDERLLLAALTVPAALDPWLALLRERQLPLIGVYSLPFVGTELLRKLGIDDEYCLFLTVQDRSLRESFFEHGQPRFSRLLSLDHAPVASLAQTLASEAKSLQQYLLSQRLISRDRPLRTVVVVHPQAAKAVAAGCASSESLSFDLRSTDDVARRTGLKTLPADSRLDAAYVHLLATKPPTLQFAGAPLRRDYRIRQIRNGLYGCGAAALLACLLFAGRQAFEADRLNRQAAEMLAQAQDARQRYDGIARSFPPIPANRETLHRIVGYHAELERTGTSPEDFYRDLSIALNHVPDIGIDSIDWQAADSTTAAGSGQTVVLRGTVKLGPSASPRQQLAAFRQFVQTLAANPALTVTTSQQPFDVEAGKVQHDGDTPNLETTAHPFTLEIARRSGA